MRLAPGVFVRANVGRFTKIGRAWIPRWGQVSHVNENPMGYAIVVVAGVVVIIRWESSGKGIDPCAGSNQILVAIQPRDLWVGASRTEMGACFATRGVTSGADGLFQCLEGVFHP